MNEYILHTKDLNSSLVFYRALFDQMPSSMDAFGFEFELEGLKVRIKETKEIQPAITNPFHLKMKRIQLKKVYNKMKRFTRLNQLKEDCEKPESAIGLIDPDGYKWIIGEHQEEISFEKCYINF